MLRPTVSSLLFVLHVLAELRESMSHIVGCSLCYRRLITLSKDFGVGNAYFTALVITKRLVFPSLSARIRELLMVCFAIQVSGVIVRVVSEVMIDLPGDLELASPFIETISTLNS